MRPVRKIDFSVKDYMIRPEAKTITDFMMKKGAPITEFVEGEKKVYDIYEVHNPYRNPKTQYFAVDERELLDNVLAISRSVFNLKERKAEERGFNAGKLDGYKQGINDTVTAIKTLPWYKRLFNYF